MSARLVETAVILSQPQRVNDNSSARVHPPPLTFRGPFIVSQTPIMAEQLVLRGTLEGHNGWVTSLATSLEKYVETAIAGGKKKKKEKERKYTGKICDGDYVEILDMDSDLRSFD